MKFNSNTIAGSDIDADTFIVLVTYNSEDFIEKCINSIFASSYKKWFLAIVDNNSSDSTLEKLKSFSDSGKVLNAENSKLICLKKNTGFAAAVNYAVFNYLYRQNASLAGYIRFLVLVNPDLVLEKDSISNLLNVFENRSSKPNRADCVGAVGGIIYDYEKRSIRNAGGMIKDNFITYHLDRPPDGCELYSADYVSGALLAVKISDYIKLKGFDTGYRPLYFEELDLCLKLRRAGLQSLISTRVIGRHFEGASVKKFSSNFYRHYHKNRIRCAVINSGFIVFFKKFLHEEINWLKNEATPDQKQALVSAYFLNFLFFLYNLIIRLKNNINMRQINKFN